MANDFNLTPKIEVPQRVDERLAALNNEEIEKAVLGAMMSYEGLYLQVKDQLTADLFHFLKWKDLFNVIKEVGDAGEFPDPILVWNKLREKHIETIQNTELFETMKFCHGGDIGYHISILQDFDTRRKLWQEGMRLASMSLNMTMTIESIMEDHKHGLDGTIYKEKDSTIYSLDDVLQEVEEMVRMNQDDFTRKRGALTGFRKIDEKGGWQPSNLIIVAADSSQGKSSFALNTAINAMENGEKVAFYSLEMTREQLVSRLLSARTGIPSNSILWDKLTPSEFIHLKSVIENTRSKIGNSLYFDDHATSGLDQIINSIRVQKIKYGITGVVVDYLQILNVNDKTQQSAARKMGDAARALKNLAKELDIWILSLSQLSRDRDNPAPTMARLRDSGEIAEAADIIILIYRPEIYGKRYPEPFANKSVENTAMIDICKGRNIGLFKFLVKFEPRRCLFYDPEPNDPIPDYYIPLPKEDSGLYENPDF